MSDSSSSKVEALCEALSGAHSLLNVDTLLDLMAAVSKELSSPGFKSSQAVQAFVKRYRDNLSAVEKQRVSTAHFTDIEVLGKGAFGEVKLVRNHQTNKVYAMKCINKSELLNKADGLSSFWEERFIMAHSNSDWIVKLYWAFQDVKNIYMVMDFMPGGDLMALCENEEVEKTEEFIRFYMAETVLAIEVLHAMGYAHRDIKPDNCLIDARGHLKVTDFGTAVRVDANGQIKSDTAVGTPDYISPEVLKSQGHSRSYGREVDWWSLGVMIFELKYDNTPFYADSLIETYSKITNHKGNLEFPPDEDGYEPASQEIMDLINGCLHPQGDKRLGFKGARDLKSHPFFLLSKWTWENIHTYPPPFDPKVVSETDTHNFQYDPSDDSSSGGGGVGKFRATDFGSAGGRNDKVDVNIFPFVGFSHYPELLAQLSAGSAAGAGDAGQVKRQLEEARRSEEKARTQANQLSLDKAALEGEFRLVQKEHRKLEIENCTLSKKLEETASKCSSMGGERDGVRRELDALRAEHKAAEKENQRLAQELAATCHRLAEGDKKGGEAERRVAEMEKQLKERERQMSAMQEENGRLTDDLESRQAEFETVYNELSSAQEANSALEETLRGVRGEKESLQAENARLDEERAGKASEVLNLRREVDRLTLEVEHERDKNKDLSREVETLNQSKADSRPDDGQEEELAQLKKQLHHEQDAKKGVAAKLQAAQQLISTLNFNLEEKRAEAEGLERTKAELAARCFKLASTLEQEKREVARVAKDLRLKSSEAETFKNKDNSLSKELAALRSAKAKQDDRVEQLAGQVGALSAKVRDLEDEVEAARLKADLDRNDMENLRDEAEELGGQLQALEGAKAALEGEVAEKERQAAEFERELVALRQQVEIDKLDVQATVDGLRGELKKRNEDMVEMRNMVEDQKAETDRVRQTVKARDEAVADMNTTLEQKTAEINKMTIERKQLIAKLSVQMGVPERSGGGQSADRADEYRRAGEKMSKKSQEANLKNKEKALKKKEQELNKNVASLEQEKLKLESERSELLNEVTSLRVELNRCNQRILELENQNVQLSAAAEKGGSGRSASSGGGDTHSLRSGELNDSLVSLNTETYYKEGRLKVQHSMVSGRGGAVKPRKGQHAWADQFVCLERRELKFFSSSDDRGRREPNQRIDLCHLLVVRAVNASDVRGDKHSAADIARMLLICFGDSSKSRIPDVSAFADFNGHVFVEQFGLQSQTCDVCGEKLQTPGSGVLSRPKPLPVVECKYCKKKLHKERWDVEKAEVHRCPAANKFETTMMLLMAQSEDDQRRWIDILSKYLTAKLTSRSASLLSVSTGGRGSISAAAGDSPLAVQQSPPTNIK